MLNSSRFPRYPVYPLDVFRIGSAALSDAGCPERGALSAAGCGRGVCVWIYPAAITILRLSLDAMYMERERSRAA